MPSGFLPGGSLYIDQLVNNDTKLIAILLIYGIYPQSKKICEI